MADINDVAQVVASALAEVSLHGTLDVTMDGGEAVQAISAPCGDDVEVVVEVRRLAA